MFIRLNRNIFIGFCVFVVVAAIILIASIKNDIQFSGSSLQNYGVTTGFKANNAECPKKLGIDFKSFLQRAICSVKDPYRDLCEAIEYVESKEPPQTDSTPDEVETLADLFTIDSKENLTVLDKFNLAISQTELYSENSTLVDELLHDMATRKIARVGEKSGGTQLKLKIEFDNGMFAIAKPMRSPREQDALPNQMQYAEFERHIAEIAAFHLDRILGFRRTMPVIGRKLNMTAEIYDVAEQVLRDTFYVSPAPDNNFCFYGNCGQYCTVKHPFCAKNDFIETAFIGFLPIYFDAKIDEITSPWRKSYDRKRKAIWERDPKYCDKVKAKDAYKGRALLDLMDQILFDFFTGNRDRHSYARFRAFKGNTFFVNFDNGRGFGHAYYDDTLNLVPLAQCCIIRSSTLKTLLRFHNGPKPLSQLMRESMANDPVAPILTEPHLEALDRRVNIILSTYRECIEKNAVEDVIYPRDNVGTKSYHSTNDF